jgi:hypothetical protein
VTDAVTAPRAVISQRREFAIIIVLSLLAVSMIVVASATNSYVPLFFAWVPYLGIGSARRYRGETGCTRQ